VSVVQVLVLWLVSSVRPDGTEAAGVVDAAEKAGRRLMGKVAMAVVAVRVRVVQVEIKIEVKDVVVEVVAEEVAVVVAGETKGRPRNEKSFPAVFLVSRSY